MPETSETVTRLYLENLSLIREANFSSQNYNHLQQPRIAILTDRLLTQNDTMLRFIMDNTEYNNNRRYNRFNRAYDRMVYTHDHDRVVTPIHGRVVSPTPTQNSAFTEVNATITTELDDFFLPVEISPTTLQIETATINICYRTISSPLNASCPITLEPFTENEIVTMIRFCNHIFKPGQINSWFQRNCRCPVCRYDIRNYLPEISNYDSDHSTDEDRSPPNEVSDSNDELSINNLSSDYIRTITENILNALITEVDSNRGIYVDDGSNNDIDALRRPSLRN